MSLKNQSQVDLQNAQQLQQPLQPQQLQQLNSKLFAFLSTKDELLRSDLPGSSNLLYVVLDSSFVKEKTSEINPEKKKKKHRREREKISELEKEPPTAPQRKRRRHRELQIYQRCCAKTVKDRCLYANLASKGNSSDITLILQFLKESNTKMLGKTCGFFRRCLI